MHHPLKHSTDRALLIVLRVISSLLLLGGVACILWLCGSTATTVLCTATFFGILATFFRKDVAAAILLATSVVWLTQMCDFFAYSIVFQIFELKVLCYALIMAALATANLFIANYFWKTTNMRPVRSARMLIIIAGAALLPALSFAYRGHDIQRARYTIDCPTGAKEFHSIVFTVDGQSTAPVEIQEHNTFGAIAINSDTDTNGLYTASCKIRVRSCFSKILSVSLIKNHSNGIFYDDAAKIAIPNPSQNGCKPLAMQVDDLWL